MRKASLRLDPKSSQRARFAAPGFSDAAVVAPQAGRGTRST